jgi:serine/threonine protein kinase/tetratricopeptide (TPR) repeat protein
MGQQFGSRYHILKQLGIGGMGAVYQAWDSELEVAVALKVIRPEVTRDPVAAQDIERRFKQELLLARQVTHKNVVRIHDLGEIDGIKYITMSYIEGSDLATVLRNEKLTVPKVVAIAREIAAGLQAAHEAGVVHRDLKPANVMIEHDHAIIMDFGIARSTSRGGAPAAPRPTGAGQLDAVAPADDELTRVAATIVGEVIGTIEYMAPEQARGEHVDQRADVYAFGLIIYDMLVGRRRSEHAVSAVGELQKRLAQTPPPVRSLVPAVPEALDALVTRCIEPEAEKRFQTTAELVAALDLLDDNGKLKPKKRVVGLPLAAAVVTLLLSVSVGVWWYFWRLIPVAEHAPVTVVIADFQNNTGDPSFDRTLEPILKLALEGASFISAYDRSSIGRLGAAQTPPTLDEVAARTLAVQQGVSVVVSGSVARRGNGYGVSVKAVQSATGEVFATEEGSASTKQQVLTTVTELAADVRSALGDDVSDSAKYFSMETLTVASLDAVSHYVAGMDAQLNQRYEDAIERFSKAVAIDPNFGYAYAAMSTAARNLSKQEDAQKYAKAAMSQVDRMTERERFRARGLFFMTTGDYKACTDEFADLVKKFPADDAAFNNLGVCSTRLRTLERSLEARRKAVAILPNRPVYRSNMAFDATYFGDFQTGEREARKAQELGSPLSGSIALAFAQLAQGQVPAAMTTYKSVTTTTNSGLAMSRVSLGLGQLAVYEGRLSEAVGILERGAAADVMAMLPPELAAQKFVAIGEVQQMRQQRSAALAAADKALKLSQSVKVRFLAARVFVDAGQIAAAQKLAASLGAELETEPQALAKVIEGEIALSKNEARPAIKVLTEANGILDTWIGRFDLGRAYLAAGLPTQAEGEFDRCFDRRGESLSLFLDDQPTLGYLPLLYYYRGRVFEELKTANFSEAYRTYLNIRGKAGEDPLLPEVRKRVGG